MAYNVRFSDELNKGVIVVEDSEINTDTSLGLVGRQVADYGETLNINFLHLLENFANSTPPRNPVEGQLWYDTREGVDQLKLYDGTGWVAAGGLKKSTTEPSSTNSVNGDLWVNTSTSQLYLYSGGSWILIGPQNTSNTGIIAATIVDTQNADQSVLQILVDNVVIGLIADDNFTPKSPIAGFNKVWEDTSTIIRKGINLSRSIAGEQGRLSGTAAYAEKLIYGNTEIPAENVLQSNIENLLTKKLKIQNNGGVDIGSPANMRIIVEGTDSVIQHLGSGTFDIRNTDYATPAFRVKAGITDNNIGINNASPDATLDITGNLKVSTTAEIGGNVSLNGNLTVTNDITVGDNATIQGNITGYSLFPDQTNSYNIGSNGLVYNGAYIETIRTNNIIPLDAGNVITVQAELQGNADTATKLKTPVQLQIAGDMASSVVQFDGSGIQLKTITTSISPDAINAQTSGGAALSTDEVLAFRSGTGLVKITQNDFIGTIPFFPLGTILPYAGTTEPLTLWKWCNGQALLWTEFRDLANALGMIEADSTTWKYGTDASLVGSGYFRLPDLRGRNAVGNMSMADGINVLPAGTTNRISNANIEGYVAGDETKTITEANLPDHTHDLNSQNSEQFYAFTEAVADDTPTEVSSGGGIDNATGFKLDNSGGLSTVTNDPMDVVNPYLTTNYIIYVGEAA